MANTIQMYSNLDHNNQFLTSTSSLRLFNSGSFFEIIPSPISVPTIVCSYVCNKILLVAGNYNQISTFVGDDLRNKDDLPYSLNFAFLVNIFRASIRS